MDKLMIYRASGLGDFTIVAKPENHYCDFTCYELIGTDDKEQFYYKRKESVSGDDMVENLNEAQIYLHGSIKWDGCANLHFDAQDDCMLHFCGRQDTAKIGKLLDRLYDLAAELIPAWDKDCAA